MNNSHYQNLLNLVKNNKNFYMNDLKNNDYPNYTFRVFNYKSPVYEDFLEPGALECRGIMYRIDENENVTLVCRPPQKFFNLNENPFTQNLDLNDIVEMYEKHDGCLISTFIHDDKLFLKSKSAISSEMITDAKRLLTPEMISTIMTKYKDCTVNMEYCSKKFKITLDYPEPTLFVLNIRKIETGEYIPHDEIENNFKNIAKRIPIVSPSSIREMTGIEGYVARFKNGLLVKMKTDWYVKKHSQKAELTIRDLFNLSVNDELDDYISLYPSYRDKINFTQKFISDTMKSVLFIVDTEYPKYKDLPKKDFIVATKNKFNTKIKKIAFNAMVELMDGNIPNYKKHILKSDLFNDYKKLIVEV